MENPRKMEGATTIESRDSIYYITFTIDSVQPKEYDPPEKPY